jgi:hypothetical protein
MLIYLLEIFFTQILFYMLAELIFFMLNDYVQSFNIPFYLYSNENLS